MSLDLLSDEQLVDLTRAGEVAAFNHLARRWESSVFRFARRTLGNAEDARDVCQEALLKAYQNISRLREGAKFKSWVHHIAFNLCRDRFRSAKHRNPGASLDEDEYGLLEAEVSETQGVRGADEGAMRGGLQELLQDVLAKLPDEQRSCLLLREYHGFNSEEIAEITGVPAATVRTRIFYGLKTVRRTMAQRGITVQDI